MKKDPFRKGNSKNSNSDIKNNNLYPKKGTFT